MVADVLGCRACLLAGLAVFTAFPAFADDEQARRGKLIEVVERAVVTVEVPGVGAGSGFVISGDGVIATCYHVIEGAKSAKVKFQGGNSADVLGFVSVSPGKDIALLKINADDKAVPLRIAAKNPAKGDDVLAFGAPLGLEGTVSNGIVSSVRTGLDGEIKATRLDKDPDAVWVQTTAPISPGNSGGPLVNMKGEAVGINSWYRRGGQNLNFSAAAHQAATLLAAADGKVHPFDELPDPRPDAGNAGIADGDATFEYWQGIGKVNAELAHRIKLANPLGLGFQDRNDVVRAWTEFAKGVRALPVKDVDADLLAISTLDAQNADRWANAVVARDEKTFLECNEMNQRLNESYDFLRIHFANRYDLDFRSIHQQANAQQAAKDGENAGDPQKTLSYWNKVNDAKQARANAMARIQTLSARASSKACGKAALQAAKAWREYFEAVKGINLEGADAELVELATVDAQYSEKMTNALQAVYQFYNANRAKDGATAFLQGCGPLADTLTKLHDKYDFMRISLAKRYKLDFSAMRATASLVQDDQEKKEGEDDEKAASALLRVGKEFLNSPDAKKKTSAKGWLEKVIARHPNTAAAKEAAELLKGLE